MEWTTNQVVEFDGGDALVDTRDDFLCNCCSVDMIRIEAIAQSGDSGSDLVELNAFFASIYGNVSRDLIRSSHVCRLSVGLFETTMGTYLA